jgi:hypothetical protein
MTNLQNLVEEREGSDGFLVFTSEGATIYQKRRDDVSFSSDIIMEVGEIGAGVSLTKLTQARLLPSNHAL